MRSDSGYFCVRKDDTIGKIIVSDIYHCVTDCSDFTDGLYCLAAERTEERS